MQNVQANIKAANEARARVKAHCMAVSVEESPSHLLVLYPEGYSVGGVRVSMANGVVWAYDKALEKMEQEWRKDLIALGYTF